MQTGHRLDNQVALVTGAASGIAREIASAFFREGARVAIADIDLAGAEAAAQALDPSRERVMAVAMDVTDEAQVDAATDAVVARFGALDVLLSSAGNQIIAAIDALTLDQWRRLLAIHLDGAFLTTRAALRHMYPRGRGSVIYIGSVHSHLASVLKAPYVTAKHGIIGLNKTLAKEGAAHGVRANVICPGFVRTPLVDQQIPEQAETLGISEEEVIRDVMLKDTVSGEFTSLADVAETAVFLAAFPTNALTGQSIVVSHGWYMQ